MSDDTRSELVEEPEPEEDSIDRLVARFLEALTEEKPLVGEAFDVLAIVAAVICDEFGASRSSALARISRGLSRYPKERRRENLN